VTSNKLGNSFEENIVYFLSPLLIPIIVALFPQHFETRYLRSVKSEIREDGCCVASHLLFEKPSLILLLRGLHPSHAQKGNRCAKVYSISEQRAIWASMVLVNLITHAQLEAIKS
jgi:hypothetical protein